MGIYAYTYKMLLTLAFPKAGAPADFGIPDIKNNIQSAMKDFNNRFNERKRLILLRTMGRNLHIELLMPYVPNNPNRELSPFAQILVQDYHFDEYSAKPGRLFNYQMISTNATEDEVAIAISTNTERDSYDELTCGIIAEEKEIYAIQPKPITSSSTMEIKEVNNNKNVFIQMSNEILRTNNIKELDNHIKQLESLLSLTKSKRDIITRSNLTENETINK